MFRFWGQYGRWGGFWTKRERFSGSGEEDLVLGGRGRASAEQHMSRSVRSAVEDVTPIGSSKWLAYGRMKIRSKSSNQTQPELH